MKAPKDLSHAKVVAQTIWRDGRRAGMKRGLSHGLAVGFVLGLLTSSLTGLVLRWLLN